MLAKSSIVLTCFQILSKRTCAVQQHNKQAKRQLAVLCVVSSAGDTAMQHARAINDYSYYAALKTLRVQGTQCCTSRRVRACALCNSSTTTRCRLHCSTSYPWTRFSVVQCSKAAHRNSPREAHLYVSASAKAATQLCTLHL
jgi:hypothetical protein